MDQTRHLIENCLARLKQYRCIATRYVKTARNFLGAVHRIGTVVWRNGLHAPCAVSLSQGVLA